MRIMLAGGCAIALIAGNAPARAQGTDNFQIINDPTTLDWEYYGAGYKLKPIRDASLAGGAAVEVEVQKGHDPWAAGANIHLNQPIIKGRNYVIRFWARTTSAKSNNGLGRILVRFLRNSAPYPGFGDTVVDVGPEWKAYEVTGRATIDSPTSQAVVGMQMASVAQTVQIGQAVVAAGATTLAAAR